MKSHFKNDSEKKSLTTYSLVHVDKYQVANKLIEGDSVITIREKFYTHLYPCCKGDSLMWE